MKVHDLLFAGGLGDGYFKEVVIEDDGKLIVFEHMMYNEVFGQSESVPTMSFSHYVDDEDYDSSDKERLRAMYTYADREVYLFQVEDNGNLSIQLD